MKGATETEVIALERALGARLPREYRDYLLRIGRDASGPLRGTDCLIDHVLANNRYLPDLLKSNGVSWSLPPRYVCFFLHQGYIAAWFDLADPRPDPECWVCHEVDTPSPTRRGTFTSFMRTEFEAAGSVWGAG